MAHPGPYPQEEVEPKSAVEPVDDGEEEEKEPNYRHESCGTEKYISGGHKQNEFAWCEEHEKVVYFSRID